MILSTKHMSAIHSLEGLPIDINCCNKLNEQVALTSKRNDDSLKASAASKFSASGILDVLSYLFIWISDLYCEISDQGFLVWTERRRSEVHAKNKGLIFHSTDRTSEVNNRFKLYG